MAMLVRVWGQSDMHSLQPRRHTLERASYAPSGQCVEGPIRDANREDSTDEEPVLGTILELIERDFGHSRKMINDIWYSSSFVFLKVILRV